MSHQQKLSRRGANNSGSFHIPHPRLLCPPHFRGESSQNQAVEGKKPRPKPETPCVESRVFGRVSSSRGRKAGWSEPRLCGRGPPPSQLVAGQSGRAAASKQRPSESGTWRSSSGSHSSSPSGRTVVQQQRPRQEVILEFFGPRFFEVRPRLGGLRLGGTLFSEATPGVA